MQLLNKLNNGTSVCLQAVNKLAEIMNRKEVRAVGSRRGNDTDMRRKEKENRKLQLELRSEKEKLNSTIIKYQKEINEMQAVSRTVTESLMFSFFGRWHLILDFQISSQHQEYQIRKICDKSCRIKD